MSMRSSYEHQWKEIYKKDTREPYSSSKRTLTFRTKSKEHIKVLLRETGLPEKYFKGKDCLDAGCGFGRLLYATQELGAASSFGFDLTKASVDICKKEFEGNDKIHVKRGDMMDKDLYVSGMFDFVSSWGVLMYTKDPKKAFKNLCKWTAPGGYLFLHVYEKYWKPRGFCVWCVRKLVNMLPEERRTAITNKFIGDHKWLNILFEFSHSEYQAYDCYSPPVVHRFTVDQMTEWFNDNGFSQVIVTKPYVKARTWKEKIIKRIYGDYYGDFNIIGRKDHVR